VANRVADKISMLAENVYICRSGSVRARCASSYTRASALVFAAAAVLLALQPLLGATLTCFCVALACQAADTQAITAYVRHYIDQHRCARWAPRAPLPPSSQGRTLTRD
jgi:hypothetical protein